MSPTHAEAKHDHADVTALTPEEEAELDRRMAEAEDDPAILIPLDEVLAKLSTAPC